MISQIPRTLIYVMTAALLSSCATKLERSAVPEMDAATKTPSIAVIADPQLHNVYGVGVKQMSAMADLGSKVAIRPPELNLLAPFVLRDLVTRMSLHESATDPHVLLVLGDATNIACTNEYDLFVRSLSDIKGYSPVVLMAHGNHDSYLMGTANTYFPWYGNSEWTPPNQMSASATPTDEHWWGKVDAPRLGGELNWRDTCYDCGLSASTPMNKSRWLARYIESLKRDGLQFTGVPPPAGTKHVTLHYAPRPNSRLAALNYVAEGLWVRPDEAAIKTPEDYGAANAAFRSVYQSFLVQQADLTPDHRLFIIDTSVIDAAGAQGWWLASVRFARTNAGTHAHIGEKQFLVLEQLLKNSQSKKITIASHFPVKDLSAPERERLLGLLSQFESWNYLSGHTHYDAGPHEGYRWGRGYELNVASTTDWPMASNRVSFTAAPGMHRVASFQNVGSTDCQYTHPPVLAVPEVCRHLPAARKIANWPKDSRSPGSEWKAPPPCGGCVFPNEKAWQEKGKELADLRQRIHRRYEDEPAFAEFVRALASAASKAEKGRFSLGDLIP